MTSAALVIDPTRAAVALLEDAVRTPDAADLVLHNDADRGGHGRVEFGRPMSQAVRCARSATSCGRAGVGDSS